MPAFFHNKTVKITAIIILTILVVIIAGIFLIRFNQIDYLVQQKLSYAPEAGISSAPALKRDGFGDKLVTENSVAYTPPEPNPTGYTTGLEDYETTDYSLSGELKEFDDLCNTLTKLKADPNINFKQLQISTNRCYADFFVNNTQAESTLNELKSFRELEITRHTESVTRFKQQLENQTDILQQQLASVQRSLTEAERQFDELAEFAKESHDPAALSEAIRYKLQNIDNLTRRKISLNQQLANLYQQAADLNDRMNFTEFRVNVSRANPIRLNNQYRKKWRQAWDGLKETANETLIGLTVTFGVVVLWLVRLSLYLLVLLVIIRAFIKFIKWFWNKW